MSTITQTIMNNASSAVSSTVVNAENYKSINLTVTGSNTPTGTIKFFSSDAETMPDATVAASATNPWDYVAVVDLSTGSVIAGATGYAFSGTGATKRFVLNSDGNKWVGAIITSWTAGNYTVLLRGYTNFTSIG